MKNVSANFENVVFNFLKNKFWSLGNVGQFLMKTVDLIFLNKMDTFCNHNFAREPVKSEQGKHEAEPCRKKSPARNCF
jgi:hypothetical protein